MGHVDIWELGRIALRRWYIVVPTFLLAMVAAMALRANAKTDYSADASILLVAPRGFDQQTDADPVSPDNPYLSFPSALSTMADATQLSVSGDDARTEVAAEGLAASYQVYAENRQPLLTVQVTSNNAGITIDTLQMVIAMIQSDLNDRQADSGVTTENRIATEILAEATSPRPNNSARTRTALSVLAVGVLVALVAAVVVDSMTPVATTRPETDISSGLREDPHPTALRPLLDQFGPPSSGGSEGATDAPDMPDSKGSSAGAGTAAMLTQVRAQLQQLRQQSPDQHPPAKSGAQSDPGVK